MFRFLSFLCHRLCPTAGAGEVWDSYHARFLYVNYDCVRTVVSPMSPDIRSCCRILSFSADSAYRPWVSRLWKSDSGFPAPFVVSQRFHRLPGISESFFFFGRLFSAAPMVFSVFIGIFSASALFAKRLDEISANRQNQTADMVRQTQLTDLSASSACSVCPAHRFLFSLTNNSRKTVPLRSVLREFSVLRFKFLLFFGFFYFSLKDNLITIRIINA